LAEKFGERYPLHIWSYPPHFLLPLSLMPYLVAYVVYCAAGLIIYLAVVTEGRRRASSPHTKASAQRGEGHARDCYEIHSTD
jgi:hypothetical protein